MKAKSQGTKPMLVISGGDDDMSKLEVDRDRQRRQRTQHVEPESQSRSTDESYKSEESSEGSASTRLAAARLRRKLDMQGRKSPGSLPKANFPRSRVKRTIRPDYTEEMRDRDRTMVLSTITGQHTPMRQHSPIRARLSDNIDDRINHQYYLDLEEKNALLERLEKRNTFLERNSRQLLARLDKVENMVKDMSSKSGTSDSHGGETDNTQEVFETPIPKAVGGTNVEVARPQDPNPVTKQQDSYVPGEKYCDGTPDVNKCSKIIEFFTKSLRLENKTQWQMYSYRMQAVIAEQLWDKDLIDIKKTWNPEDPESPKQRKKRFELYKVIVGTVGREHAEKLDNPLNVEDMGNVNAAWKILETSFNDQYLQSNVGDVRRNFQNCTMAETGFTVVQYRIELEKRLSN